MLRANTCYQAIHDKNTISPRTPRKACSKLANASWLETKSIPGKSLRTYKPSPKLRWQIRRRPFPLDVQIVATVDAIRAERLDTRPIAKKANFRDAKAQTEPSRLLKPSFATKD